MTPGTDALVRHPGTDAHVCKYFCNCSDHELITRNLITNYNNNIKHILIAVLCNISYRGSHEDWFQSNIYNVIVN